MAATASTTKTHDSVLDAVRKYWGYTSLRPLQAEAIEAGLDRHDSLVVLPTGGGKSLCYQVPPAVAGRTDVVVSPLISLMKDQVDALAACGYPAAGLYGSLSDEERRSVSAGALAGRFRLLFVAPERLLSPWFLALLRRMNVGAFAIDEAHCISQWGHDFRPEYRRLTALREHFPEASIHAYTATATPRVREDIIEQLGLRQPRVLVGTFDRPNLVYRVLPRLNREQQVLEVVRRHEGEAVIVYCISRADTEALATWLRQKGVKAAAYHAGLDARTRLSVQEQFAAERIDVVVATVAFGMGIDRSNVRCVIHAAMPKSVEHYQQETGRAGRDGLEAECVLFFADHDLRAWEFLVRRSAEDAAQPEEVLRGQLQLLHEMHAFATSSVCRHRLLSRYFGQDYPRENCQACDVCLSADEPVADGAEIAAAILDCVYELRIPFGAAYVADVLTGAANGRMVRYGHDRLRQFGVLRHLDRGAVRDFILQLVALGCLDRSGGDMPVLRLTQRGRQALAGRLQLTLRQPRSLEKAPPAPGRDWEGVDRGLFEHLRLLRRRLADERGVPAFVILSDASLRELAARRPGSQGALRGIRGLGEQKLAELGPPVLEAIREYCSRHGLGVSGEAGGRAPRPHTAAGASKQQAFRLFEEGASLEEVARATGRSRSKIVSYLEDYIAERRPDTIAPWVDAPTYRRVEQTARRIGGSRLKPVFEALDGSVSYDQIRLVMRHAGLR